MNRDIKGRVLAWVLAFVMVASVIMVPADKVKAAEITEVELNVDTTEKTATVSGGTTLDVNIDVPADYNTTAKLNDAGLSKLQIKYVVSSFTAAEGKDAGAQPFLFYNNDWVSHSVWNNIAKDTESTLTLNLPISAAAVQSVDKFGIQFANITGSITYKIISAKLLGDGSTGGGNETEEETGITDGDVTGNVYALPGGSADWMEYNYSVSNGTDSPISGIKIKVPYTGTVKDLKSFGCNVSLSGSNIVISHTSVLEAGRSYSCKGDTTIKFGFGGGATLGTPVVEFVYGTDGGGTSSSDLKYELTGKAKEVEFKDTPVGKHGKLSLADVDGYDTPVIVDKNGKPFQLRGASSHGIQWDVGYNYVNKGSYQSLRDEWGVNLVRLASYVTQNGYTEGAKDSMDTVIQRGVQAATELGMYVLVDWHIHAENPHTTKTQAEEFFKKYATMYKDYDNVIFEICNEPTGVEWYNGSGADLYSYCKDIAKIIRDCGSDALIICGTNTWSQDVDDVVKKPLKDDNFKNILYTFHFYSGSHYEDKMNKVKTAIKDGTPLFVTEFGICDASGNGNFDTANADKWIELFDKNGVSYCCWSLCNKAESASYLATSCSKTEGGWVESDLATTGKWLVNTYRAHQDAEEGTSSVVGDFTLSLEPENGVIAEVEEGYRSAGKITVTITNTGDTDLEDLSVSFGKKENTDFEVVNNLTSTTLEAGTSASIDISLKTGKSAGKYADSVVVSSGTIKKTKNISQTVTVKKIPLTGIKLSKDLISLEKGEDATVSVENSDVVITAEPEGASLGELGFSSSDTKVATVDEDGNITAVGKGSAVITVSSGDISKELTEDVKVTPQGINMKEAVSLTLTEGENTETLVAKVIPEDADNAVIRWEIPKNEIIATEGDKEDSSKLYITALSKGTVTISAYIADVAGTTAAATEIKKDCVITVTQEIESIIIGEDDVLMTTTKGENTKQLIASTVPADAEGVAWTSSNSKVATVSQDGLVTALGSGEAVITAQIGSKKDTCIVKVVKPIESAAITDNKGDVLETLKMQEGDTMKVKGSVTPKDATGADVMEWSVSEGTDIISFDPETGVVTALKEGTAKLTLKVGKDVDNILNTKTAVLQVTVSKKATNPSGGNTDPNSENTDPNGENTDPSGENTDPSGKTTGPDVVIDKPNVINISELPGGAEYKGDSIPDSCYITYTDGVDKPTALYEEGRLTLLLNTDYKLVGTNEMLTITFRKAEEEAGRVSNENIVLDGVTVKAVDADVPVTLTGNTTVKGNVEASNITITAGIVNIGGSINADDKVTITDGKVTVEDGINAGGEIVIHSKATLSVNVAKKAENGQSNAITGSAITVEDGAAITAGNNVDSNLFSVAPKNEKGEAIDVSKYTGNKSSDIGENGNSDANNPQQTGGTDITTDGGAQSPQVINATDMTIMADVKGVKGVNAAGTYQLAKGKSMTLSAAFSPEGAVGENITVTSSNAKIVAVNGNKLTGEKAGTATITVTSDNGIVKNFKVKVMKKAVSKVKFKSSKKTVKVGKTLKLKAVTTPAKKAGSKLYWKSANENVATVTQKGIVKGMKKGKVKITAIALDGSGKKATVKITVK